MKKLAFILTIILLQTNIVIAQSPQFAVVRPNGTTYICPNWDSAYNKSQNGDFIYLPGTNINTNIILEKNLTIIGAGHYPDSTVATGSTIINGDISIFKKCYLEGLNISGSITVSDTMGNNSTFIRLRCSYFYFVGTSNHFVNSCVLAGLSGTFQNCSPSRTTNNLISNSIFEGGRLSNIENSHIANCIFLGIWNSWMYAQPINCSFSNNIFKGLIDLSWGNGNPCYTIIGNSFNNNIFTQGSLPLNSGNSNNYLSVNYDSILVNQTGTIFDYQHNYHLRPNSQFFNAGDDGTEIGLFGGTSYAEGAVPSNPHIYFKHIAPQTNSNGELQIQFKVRTNN